MFELGFVLGEAAVELVGDTVDDDKDIAEEAVLGVNVLDELVVTCVNGKTEVELIGVLELVDVETVGGLVVEDGDRGLAAVEVFESVVVLEIVDVGFGVGELFDGLILVVVVDGTVVVGVTVGVVLAEVVFGVVVVGVVVGVVVLAVVVGVAVLAVVVGVVVLAVVVGVAVLAVVVGIVVLAMVV